jgi:hypothetical protein
MGFHESAAPSSPAASTTDRRANSCCAPFCLLVPNSRGLAEFQAEALVGAGPLPLARVVKPASGRRISHYT